MPRVSVLIPAYRPDYLRQAIASVLAQTFGDYELVISDDCPDDGVKQVAREFGDARIRLLEGPRQGLVANSAFLFEQAACELIKFVYDDDFLLPFAIATMGGLLMKHPAAAFAYTQRHAVDGEGRGLKTPYGLLPGPARLFEPREVVSALMAQMRNPIGEPTNVLFRRSRLGGVESLRSYAGLPIRHLIDLTMYLNAFDHGPCVGLGEAHTAFRRHAGQATSINSPTFSRGVFEWEIFLRGEVRNGRCPRADALRAVVELDRRYALQEARHPELSLFRAGLPALRARIEAGDRDLLDGEFRDRLDRASALVDERTRREPEG